MGSWELRLVYFLSKESGVVTEGKNTKIKWTLQYFGIFPNTYSSLGEA